MGIFCTPFVSIVKKNSDFDLKTTAPPSLSWMLNQSWRQAINSARNWWYGQWWITQNAHLPSQRSRKYWPFSVTKRIRKNYFGSLLTENTEPLSRVILEMSSSNPEKYWRKSNLSRVFKLPTGLVQAPMDHLRKSQKSACNTSNELWNQPQCCLLQRREKAGSAVARLPSPACLLCLRQKATGECGTCTAHLKYFLQ